ncbi:MAG: thioredoxin [Proteobacteria bacterium]|nr:thioredoxin [Pseudomonadota bacterium]
MAGNLIEVTDSTFQNEVLDSALPVLVDFWAAWCGPCLALAPSIEAVAGEQAGKVKVCKLDVDSNPEVAGKFGIRSIPTIILFKAGQPAAQMVGNLPKAAIDDFLKMHA